MDELELLKKDWKKREQHIPKLSYGEIYNMIWKKSSSIVKWILIISVIELAVPHLLYLLPWARQNMDIYHKLGLSPAIMVSSVVQYTVVFYFIYLFYKRYKEISVLDSAKDLMSKILSTRRTVKYYIIFGLSNMFVVCLILITGIYLTPDITDIFPMPQNEHLTPEKFKSIMMWSMGLMSLVLILFVGGIYFLLYGRLIRKLHKNYKELKKLEVED